MGYYRVRKDKENPYVLVNKYCINDNTISWKAKGILLYMLSKPDDWKLYENEIVKNAKCGRESTRTGIQELIDAGYIDRKRRRSKVGKFEGYEYDVYEVPYHVRKPDNGKSDNGKPDNGKTYNGKPDTSNNELTNNELTNNEETKERINNISYVSLPTSDNVFFHIYNKHFENRYGKHHMRISPYHLICAEDAMYQLEMSVTTEQFEEGVKQHFIDIPFSNDGCITYFLHRVKDIFGITVELPARAEY